MLFLRFLLLFYFFFKGVFWGVFPHQLHSSIDTYCTNNPKTQLYAELVILGYVDLTSRCCSKQVGILMDILDSVGRLVIIMDTPFNFLTWDEALRLSSIMSTQP